MPPSPRIVLTGPVETVVLSMLCLEARWWPKNRWNLSAGSAKAAGIKVNDFARHEFFGYSLCPVGSRPYDGVTVVDAADIAKLPPDLNTGLIITQVYSRQVASDAKLSLMEYLS